VNRSSQKMRNKYGSEQASAPQYFLERILAYNLTFLVKMYASLFIKIMLQANKCIVSYHFIRQKVKTLLLDEHNCHLSVTYGEYNLE